MNFDNTIKKLREKYPNRIPVIIETNQKDLNISKKKYLVPKDYTVRDFQNIIRNKLDLNNSESIYIYCKNMMCLPSTTFLTIMEQQNNPSHLVLHYGKEETYG